MACLYRITFPGGKSYIGITVMTAPQRFYRHASAAKKGSKLAVHAAIRKYGEGTAKLETLAIASWEYVKELEKKVIAAFDTRPPRGFNLTDGGDGITGHKHSERTREKLRQRVYSEEIRAAMSRGALGKKQKHNTSGYPGVIWDKAIAKWRPRITQRGKMKYLGVFADWLDAVSARKSAELRFRNGSLA